MMTTPHTSYTLIPSPVGTLLLVGRPGVLTGLYVHDHDGAPAVDPAWVEDAAPFREARRQLEEYFAGTRQRFDLDLDLEGTPFQREVWQSLLDVPYGRTASYGDIARAIGRPSASRAVGAANGSNPVSIVVPCHRVVGADGSLTGYGWGTERKAWLLEHEQAVAGTRTPAQTALDVAAGMGTP